MERLDRNRLHIGTYILQPYAQTQRHVKEMAEAGIDLLVCLVPARPEIFDWLEKYRIQAIVSNVVPGWWGGNGENAGKMREERPLALVEEAARNYEDRPAVCGIDIGDEPSALDFPHYGAYARRTRVLFPHLFPYLNLYPNYASVAENDAAETVNQLGTKTYAEYVDAYCQYVDLDYICYDYYMYAATVAGAFDNLRTVADAARRTGRRMWIVLQVNSSRPDSYLTENQLRFQAFSAMAFGAEIITWACWTGGWWYNNVLDEEGNKTKQYKKLQTVNGEIRRMADVYMRYRRTETYFLGFPPDAPGIGKSGIDVLRTGTFLDVTAESGRLILGTFVPRKSENGGGGLFLCAAENDGDEPAEYTVTFKAPERTVTLYTGREERTLAPDAEGKYTVRLSACEGAMITAI